MLGKKGHTHRNKSLLDKITAIFTSAQSAKLDSLNAAPKNNLTATAAPTASDDSASGYSEGSTWVYNSTTYTCVSATASDAVWVSSADVYFFDTWDLLVSAISVAGTTYVNKYATVANANGGPIGGATYTAPATLSTTILDGGQATYKVAAQGSTYSVTCQARTITNPVITAVQTTAVVKPTVAGYYIFTIAPSNSLPTGVSLGDIAYYSGTTWSQFQAYAKCPAGVVVGATTATQQMWFKSLGTWTTVTDKTASGYIDISSLRIQWGEVAAGTAATTTVTLPMPFGDTTYKVAASVLQSGAGNGASFSVSIYSRTTTQFGANKLFNNAGTVNYCSEGFSWVAIGVKP